MSKLIFYQHLLYKSDSTLHSDRILLVDSSAESLFYNVKSSLTNPSSQQSPPADKWCPSEKKKIKISIDT